MCNHLFKFSLLISFNHMVLHFSDTLQFSHILLFLPQSGKWHWSIGALVDRLCNTYFPLPAIELLNTQRVGRCPVPHAHTQTPARKLTHTQQNNQHPFLPCKHVFHCIELTYFIYILAFCRPTCFKYDTVSAPYCSSTQHEQQHAELQLQTAAGEAENL